MNRARRAVAVVVTCTGLVASTVAVAGPASARAYQCEMVNYWSGQLAYAKSMNGDRDCTLRNGNNWHYGDQAFGLARESSGVYALQMSLHYCHGQNIAIDGYFGPGTQQAVMNVQGSLRITRDGIFGKQTSSRMSWLTRGGTNGYTHPCSQSYPAGPGPVSIAD